MNNKIYLLEDTFENTSKLVREQYLRELYLKDIEDIIFNWKDCGDESIKLGLEKDKNEVFTCDIKKVITTLMDDDKWLKIREWDLNKGVINSD